MDREPKLSDIQIVKTEVGPLQFSTSDPMIENGVYFATETTAWRMISIYYEDGSILSGKMVDMSWKNPVKEETVEPHAVRDCYVTEIPEITPETKKEINISPEAIEEIRKWNVSTSIKMDTPKVTMFPPKGTATPDVCRCNLLVSGCTCGVFKREMEEKQRKEKDV